MKKLLLALSIIFIIFSSSACSVESAAEHESNKAAEAESIENLTSTSSEETTIANSESGASTISADSSSTATTNNSNVVATTAASSNGNNTVTVYLTAKCSNAIGNPGSSSITIPSSGYFCYDQEVTINKGDTVYNVLTNADALKYIDANIKSSFAYGKYLIGINGLNEFDCGASSGWKYIITGNSSPLSISSVVPNNGDHIDFFYALTSTDTFN